MIGFATSPLEIRDMAAKKAAGKENKEFSMRVRMTPEMRRRLDEEAERDQISASSLVRQLIAQHCRRSAK